MRVSHSRTTDDRSEQRLRTLNDAKDRIVHRTRRERNILYFNPWNMDADVGDYMITIDGEAYRLEESSGWARRTSGELYPRTIRKSGYKATIEKDENGENILVWVKNE